MLQLGLIHIREFTSMFKVTTRYLLGLYACIDQGIYLACFNPLCVFLAYSEGGTTPLT